MRASSAFLAMSDGSIPSASAAAAKLIADSGKATPAEIKEMAFMAYKVEIFEIVQSIISEQQLKELQQQLPGVQPRARASGPPATVRAAKVAQGWPPGSTFSSTFVGG